MNASNQETTASIPCSAEAMQRMLAKIEKSRARRTYLKSHSYLLLCMLIPAIVMYLIYLARGIHPFGNGTVLVLDLNGQYVWFFEALRNAVKGDASMLYSFARALGGEFLGIYAYYIASPLSYIVCLFPEDRMLEALLTLFILKTAICGGTFGFYMHKTSTERKPLSIVVFSVFYALSAYAIVQQHNTMWIDAVAWLPLITLGIESLIKHGKFKLYTIFLALTLFSNFYIGYMVCIYCFFYFFLYYFGHAEDRRNNPLYERFHFIKSLLRIAFYSMIAIGIAAIVLLCAYYALNFGKTTFSETKWEFLTNFDILDLLYKLLPGSYDTVRPEGLPFIYCGVMTLLFIPAYFLSKKYPMRQKIFSGILIFVLVVLMSLNVTDLIMHGFQAPNWLNYRYSFMLSFYLCVIACRAFSAFEGVSLQGLMGMGGLIALLCVILQKYTSGEYVDPNDYSTIWFSLIAVFAYLAVLAILRKTNRRRLTAFVLVLIVCVETFLSGLFHLNELDADVGYSRYSYYNNFLNKARPIVEMVQERDKSFYRMEKTFFRSTNDNMALKMRGLSGSTSTLNKETVQFLNKMGYSSRSHWSKYLGGTPVNDSLLGLKYIISDKDLNHDLYTPFVTDEATGYTAYYNPYALSIAYGVDDKLLDFKLGFTNEVKKNNNNTDNQDEDAPIEVDEVGNLVDKLKNKINEWLGIDETQTFSKYEDKHTSPFERINDIVTTMIGAEELQHVFVPIEYRTDPINLAESRVLGQYSVETAYKKTMENEDGILSMTLTVPKSGEIYFYLPTYYPREVKAEILDTNISSNYIDIGTYNGNETTRILSLGYHEAGTLLTLDLTLTQEYLYVVERFESAFYYIDDELFKSVMTQIGQDQLEVTDYTEDEIHGSFTASRAHETVLTTIPYDKGWEIYVDGVRVPITKALGALISFSIDGEAGATHRVDMIYNPNTYGIGLTVSIASAGLLLILIILERPLKKVPVLRAIVTAVPRKKKR